MKSSHKVTACAAAGIAMLITICAGARAKEQPMVTAYLTRNRLFDQCSAPSDDFRILQCYSYISGAIDGAAALAIDAGHAPPECPPNGVTKGQLKDIVLRYLKGHPEKRHLQAASLVIASVGEAFHCGW
jgi:hypothetical protein